MTMRPLTTIEVGEEASLSRISYRRFADVEPERIDWLWPGYIARGKTTMIAGDPGLGKSQITASLASIASKGGRWPIDRSLSPSGNVIIISAEDDAGDTIRPRLDAAGADVQNVYVVDAVLEGERERHLSLEADVQRIHAMIDEIGDVVLVIIDPISAYLGSTRDSNKMSDMRGLLAPLARMATHTNAAFVMVSHLTKSIGANALGRVQGSLAFVAAARAAYIVTKDPDNESRRLFLPAKNNIGPDTAGLAYNIESAIVGSDIQTSRISWHSEPVAMSADDALSVSAMDDDERTERSDAAEFLRDLLQDGPMPASEVLKAGGGAGYSKRTLQRARKDAGATTRREGFIDGARWVWDLVDRPPKDSPSEEEKY